MRSHLRTKDLPLHHPCRVAVSYVRHDMVFDSVRRQTNIVQRAEKQPSQTNHHHSNQVMPRPQNNARYKATSLPPPP